jgi:predicted transposase YbfD/YdcC
VSQSIPSLAASLAQIPDPRAARGRRHAWSGLLLLVAMGLLCGCNSQRALARFGHHLRRPWLQRVGLQRPPSQPTLARLLSTVEVAQVETQLRSWVGQLRTGWRQAAATWVEGIAIDGKTLGGARRLGATDTHLLSAYRVEDGQVLAQVAVPAKTGEVRVVDRLLAQLDLTAQTVTFDAAFTHASVATAVLEEGGAYLMVVKGNQPTLRRDIAEATARRGCCTSHTEQTQAGHGRIERRTLWVAPATAVREHVLGFPGAQQILELHRHVVVKRTGQVRRETVYAVTSLTAAQADASALLHLWQSHWGIENRLHWVRDVVFGEDQSLTRTGQAPQVLAAFRNLALAVIHQWRGPAITASREYYAAHLGVLCHHLGLP